MELVGCFFYRSGFLSFVMVKDISEYLLQLMCCGQEITRMLK